ncbi:hypothetical protein ACFPIJ_08035 [Dactylosporangium cerinum]|uniref:Uncharacterized protein n=1 Tax=Dactylosporangium cerinum TaxID=1434730 RepID=A0ABV9VQ25_9ACTN
MVRNRTTTINDDPKVLLRVRLDPAAGGDAVTVEATRIVSRLMTPRPGERYAAYYDPADHRRFLLVAVLPAAP